MNHQLESKAAGLNRQVTRVWVVSLFGLTLYLQYGPGAWTYFSPILFCVWMGGTFWVQWKVIASTFVRAGQNETERLKAAIQQTEKNSDSALQQQIRFTADASHELRTPVSVIMAQTQMALSREREAAEYVESLKMCRRAGERMKGLLEELLDLSKFDAGAFRLRLAECDLAELARESIAFVAPLAADRRVTLENEAVSVMRKVDPSAFGRALINLLNNAIIHNPPETRVRLTVVSSSSGVCITVSDNGLGISEETLPRIFERFARGDKSRTRATGGTGLGLAIVHAIVHSHGGEIRAESKIGSGTKFEILLP